MRWQEAQERGRSLLDGVERHRIPPSESGVELAILDWGGDGDLAVIHHANGFCAATYAPIAVELRSRYRVVSIDARGHGDSTSIDPAQNPAAYSWHTMAEDYAAAHRHLAATLRRDRIGLAIGHSFGGTLTLAAAARNPGLIQEALLLDAVVLPPASERGIGSNSIPDRGAKARRRRRDFATREEAYNHFAGRGLFKNFRPEALALYVSEGMSEISGGEVRLKCAPEVEAEIFDQARLMDVFDIASEIQTPTRLLHASQGHFSRDVYDSLASQMPNAQVESVDAGHLFALEIPEIVVDRLIDR